MTYVRTLTDVFLDLLLEDFDGGLDLCRMGLLTLLRKLKKVSNSHAE